MSNIELQNIKLEILKKQSLFTVLDDRDLRELAGISELCNISKNTILFNEGDDPRFVYIIKEGRIKSFKSTLSGRVTIANVSRDIIGLQNIISGNPLWVSGESMDDVSALKISRQDFLKYINQKPLLLVKILERAESTMNNLFNRVNELVDCSAGQRVIDILYGLYEKFGVILPFRMTEIASLTGITRETAIRVISRLKKDKIIASGRHQIVIKDFDKLRLLRQYSDLI
jgi:CRP-like cAMP-binding protein